MSPGPSPIAFVTFTTRLNAKHAQEKLKDQPIDPNNNSIHMKIEFAREDTKSENFKKHAQEKLKDKPIDPNNNSIQMKIEFAREDTKSENFKKHAQEKLKDQPIDPNNNSMKMKIEFAREDTKSENSLRGREKIEQGSNILPGVEKPSEDVEQPKIIENVEQFPSFYHPYVHPFYHPWFQQMQHDYYISKTSV